MTKPLQRESPHILFVDDEHLLHGVMERLFKRHNISLTCCSEGATAVELLGKDSFDLVITDFKMPQMDGLELLTHVRREHPQMGTIIITAHASVQHAVRSMQNGAVDYIPKPFSTEELVNRVMEILERGREPSVTAKKPLTSSGATSSAWSKPVRFVGEEDSVQQLKALLPRIAASGAPVFVHGESGTGKEVLARLLHEESDRSDKPFVAINCASLPRELVESHLFGHRKGAFTGAISDVTGAFERADGGTLLLDEITEVDCSIQAKLLRALQEREIQKVGAPERKSVDVRVIATTNRDVQEAIDTGVFREDLYHRLAVFPLTIPPLRERTSDIPALADHFLEKYCVRYGLPLKKASASLRKRFASYSWPGNVRQLENMIHRGVVLSGDRSEVRVDDVINDFFDEGGSVESSPADQPVTLEAMERQAILQTLQVTGQNQTETAKRLGVSARTIRNKLKKYREEGYFV